MPSTPVKGRVGFMISTCACNTKQVNIESPRTLAQQNVADSLVNVLVHRVATVNHEAVNKLHALCALSPQFPRDDHLAALGTTLHDVTENAVAGAAHSQPTQELVAQALALGNGTQATVLDLLGEQHHRVVLEVEAFLHGSGQLADALTLGAQHILRARGADDDLRLGGRHAHLHTAVAILRELLGEHLVQLGVEHAIGDELRTGKRISVIFDNNALLRGIQTKLSSQHTLRFLEIETDMLAGAKGRAVGSSGGVLFQAPHVVYVNYSNFLVNKTI